MEIKNNTRIFEIIAVVITGLGKFVLMDWLNLRLLYIVGACLFWIVYIFYQFKMNKQILSYWGLSSTNFRKTFLELLPVAIVAVILFVFAGNYFGTNILSWNILPILLVYPIWGIIQQFVIVGLLAGNLKDLDNISVPTFAIVLITALIFAIVHYPHYILIAGTFVLALVYTTLFLKKRNLVAMGIYHGWLGAFFFYTILERDPWQEVFGILGF